MSRPVCASLPLTEPALVCVEVSCHCSSCHQNLLHHSLSWGLGSVSRSSQLFPGSSSISGCPSHSMIPCSVAVILTASENLSRLVYFLILLIPWRSVSRSRPTRCKSITNLLISIFFSYRKILSEWFLACNVTKYTQFIIIYKYDICISYIYSLCFHICNRTMSH